MGASRIDGFAVSDSVGAVALLLRGLPGERCTTGPGWLGRVASGNNGGPWIDWRLRRGRNAGVQGRF